MTNAILDEQVVNSHQSLADSDILQLLTIRQFCATFPWPSESAMRSYIFRAKEFGLSDAFVRVGRRVLVSPSKFFVLIKNLESRFDKGGNHETTSWRKGKAPLQTFPDQKQSLV